VIAIVAGTRTKSGSTNFLRLHVMGEQALEGTRFFAPHHEETGADAPGTGDKPRRPAPRPAPKKK